MPDAQRSEELTQETFLAVLKGADRYEPRASFRSYLFGIACNLLAASRREARREAATTLRDLTLRTANARREEQRLVELLSRRTGDLDDVLAVERELARVRLEIERMEAETRATGQRVDLATVTLTVQEQYRADLALGPLPLPVRFKNALVDGLRQTSESLVGAAIVVLQIAPTLMVWMLIFAWPARWVWRRVRA